MSMKNSNDTIWNRTSDIPICSTARLTHSTYHNHAEKNNVYQPNSIISIDYTTMQQRKAKHFSGSEYISSRQMTRNSENTTKPTDVIFGYLAAVSIKRSVVWFVTLWSLVYFYWQLRGAQNPHDSHSSFLLNISTLLPTFTGWDNLHTCYCLIRCD